MDVVTDFLTGDVVTAGAGPPLHVHDHEDECCYVLDGALFVRCGAAVDDDERTWVGARYGIRVVPG
jgi:uncharacterized cupin superfamily protein